MTLWIRQHLFIIYLLFRYKGDLRHGQYVVRRLDRMLAIREKAVKYKIASLMERLELYEQMLEELEALERK